MLSKYSLYNEKILELAKEHNYNVFHTAKALKIHLGDLSEKRPGNAIYAYCKKIIEGKSQVGLELNERGVSTDDFRHGWIKTKEGSYFIKNERIINYDEIKEQLLDDIKNYAYQYPKIEYPRKETENLLILDIADLHINKLINGYEVGESTKNVEEFKEIIFSKVQTLIKRTSSFNITNIVFVGGNDVLHTDNPQNTTTSGTRQDVSIMWFDAFIEARKLYVELIEYLTQIAPVHFVFVPSNHDYMSGFHLAQTIYAWFNNNPNVSFDISPAHRKYFQFGKSLIGLTHGDGAKECDLPDLMKIEAKDAYSMTDFCYWYTHHIHHKDKSNYRGKQKVQLEKDYRDVKIIHTGKNLSKTINRTHVEYLRSANGTDSWHHKQGFQHSPIGIECFVHDTENGQIGSFFE